MTTMSWKHLSEIDLKHVLCVSLLSRSWLCEIFESLIIAMEIGVGRVVLQLVVVGVVGVLELLSLGCNSIA